MVAISALADELIAPYRTVVDIDKAALPSVDTVKAWSSADYTTALRHDPANSGYNPHFRQLLHVGFKVAAQMGPAYLQALQTHRQSVARNVTENLLLRHMQPISQLNRY